MFFTTKLEDKNVVDIGSDVTLSCCLDKGYGVQWYKDQSKICMNDKFRFKDEQRKHKLIITDIQGFSFNLFVLIMKKEPY
jgi:hypothetical protein